MSSVQIPDLEQTAPMNTYETVDYCAHEIAEIAVSAGWAHLRTERSDRSAASRYIYLQRGECSCCIRLSDHKAISSNGYDFNLVLSDYTESQLLSKLDEVFESCN